MGVPAPSWRFAHRRGHPVLGKALNSQRCWYRDCEIEVSRTRRDDPGSTRTYATRFSQSSAKQLSVTFPRWLLSFLLVCSTGQSTSLMPSPSVQQAITSVVNETATVNVSMTVSSNYSLIQQTSSVNPSSAVMVSVHSSVTSTSPTTTSESNTSWYF